MEDKTPKVCKFYEIDSLDNSTYCIKTGEACSDCKDEINNSVEIQNLKSIAEPDFDRVNDPEWQSRSEIYWKELEKISTEMSDDDPRMTPGYHQFTLDAHTKDVMRAKGMLKARDSLAQLMAGLQGILGK